MPIEIDFQPTETEHLQVTESIRKGKRPEVRQRATVVQPLQLGQKPAEVAESLAAQRPRAERPGKEQSNPFSRAGRVRSSEWLGGIGGYPQQDVAC